MTVPTTAALIGRGVLAAPKPLKGPTTAALQGRGVIAPAGSPILPGDGPAVPPTPPLAVPDFNALTGVDSQYTTGEADLKRQNDHAVAALNQAFATNSQGAQDNANAHGALFSGAAVHAQNYLAQQAAQQASQQAEGWQQAQHALYVNVFNRLISQLAPAGTTQQPVIPTG